MDDFVPHPRFPELLINAAIIEEIEAKLIKQFEGAEDYLGSNLVAAKVEEASCGCVLKAYIKVSDLLHPAATGEKTAFATVLFHLLVTSCSPEHEKRRGIPQEVYNKLDDSVLPPEVIVVPLDEEWLRAQSDDD